ncbi:hypothetical protein R1sor_010544 [Riccia sorocarpa]|uniref:Uncharacterized protein n=1 Tax=Riccia sorocarpa TaxID=122646 RepID=A0ABD3HYB7_9MARC
MVAIFVGKRLSSQFASAFHGFLKKIAQFVSLTFKDHKDVDEVELSAMNALKMLKYVTGVQRCCVPEDVFWYSFWNTDADGDRLLIKGMDGATCVIGWHEVGSEATISKLRDELSGLLQQMQTHKASGDKFKAAFHAEMQKTASLDEQIVVLKGQVESQKFVADRAEKAESTLRAELTKVKTELLMLQIAGATPFPMLYVLNGLYISVFSVTTVYVLTVFLYCSTCGYSIFSVSC